MSRVEPPTGTKGGLFVRVGGSTRDKRLLSPPLARLAFGPGTKATFYPGPKGNRDKKPETKAYSVVVRAKKFTCKFLRCMLLLNTAFDVTTSYLSVQYIYVYKRVKKEKKCALLSRKQRYSRAVAHAAATRQRDQPLACTAVWPRAVAWQKRMPAAGL